MSGSEKGAVGEKGRMETRGGVEEKKFEREKMV